MDKLPLGPQNQAENTCYTTMKKFYPEDVPLTIRYNLLEVHNPRYRELQSYLVLDINGYLHDESKG